MEMDLELEWQDAGWERMIWRLPGEASYRRSGFLPCWAPWMRRAQGRRPDADGSGGGTGCIRPASRRISGCGGRAAGPGVGAGAPGRAPGALDPGDPLRPHWQDLEALPRLDGQAAQALAGKGAGANRFTEGLLWLVLQEALDFVGQGVLCSWI